MEWSKGLVAGLVAALAPSLMWWAVSYSPEGWAGWLLWTNWLMPVPGLVAFSRLGVASWRLHMLNGVVGALGTGILAVFVTGRMISVPRVSAFVVSAVAVAVVMAAVRSVRVNRHV
jgi:hypothetical protein